jgi:succinate dehydrogenase hydrophobic anchor subunit
VPYSDTVKGAGVTVLLLAALAVWVINIGFGLWRGFHDLVDGKRWQAALGIACVVGVNIVLGWMIYAAISSSTDL